MADTAILTIKVLAGKELIACDRGGTSDPYCIVTVGNTKKHTKTIKRTVEPVWSEQDLEPFIFHVVEANTTTEILFEVFDWNRVMTHKHMGRVKLLLKDIIESNGEYNKWIPLEADKHTYNPSDVDISKPNSLGSLHVSIQLHKEGRRNTIMKSLNSHDIASSSPIQTSLTSRGSLYRDENNEEEEIPLFSAIKNSYLDKVKDLIRSPDCNVNIRDKFGYTPLHAACCLFSEKDDEILGLLLSHKDIDVNVENDDKNTPLHYFCQKFRSPNCQEAFDLFIKKGANVNAVNNNGETPLHKAIFNNSVRILMVNLLIKGKADVNTVNSQGETALHYAVRLGREDLVQILVKAGSDINVRGLREKKTPYELAVEQNHQKMTVLLVRAKDLYDFLVEIGVEQYYPIFIKEEIFKDIMSELDESILQRIGITVTGHQLKILKAAKNLKEEKMKTSGGGLGTASSYNLNTTGSDSSSPDSSISNSIGGNATPIAQPANAEPEGPKKVDMEQELEKLKYIKSKDWILHNSELEFTVKLGSGTSGTVYKGLYKGEEVAIKVLKTEQSNKEVEEFKKEFQVMSAIQSPYLVFFFGAVLEPKMCMVMELCSRGSLYHVMIDNKIDIGWDRVLNFSLEMARGVECLHSWSPQIVHRDLKSLNLMVNEQFHVKVADFGLARFNTDTQKDTLVKMRGTFAYCAPEVYFGAPFSVKADVFSCAIILWELVYRCINREYARPYQEFPNLVLDFQIIIQTAKKNLRPTIPKTCPEKFANLIRACWDPKAENRLVCADIVRELEELEKDFNENKDVWNQTITPPKSS